MIFLFFIFYVNGALFNKNEMLTLFHEIRSHIPLISPLLKDSVESDLTFVERLIKNWEQDVDPEGIPTIFICPISLDIMQHPVMTPQGHFYDLQSIKQSLNIASIDPLTQTNLVVFDLKNSGFLKLMLQGYQKGIPLDENEWKQWKSMYLKFMQTPLYTESEKVYFDFYTDLTHGNWGKVKLFMNDAHRVDSFTLTEWITLFSNLMEKYPAFACKLLEFPLLISKIAENAETVYELFDLAYSYGIDEITSILLVNAKTHHHFIKYEMISFIFTESAHDDMEITFNIILDHPTFRELLLYDPDVIRTVFYMAAISDHLHIVKRMLLIEPIKNILVSSKVYSQLLNALRDSDTKVVQFLKSPLVKSEFEFNWKKFFGFVHPLDVKDFIYEFH